MKQLGLNTPGTRSRLHGGMLRRVTTFVCTSMSKCEISKSVGAGRKCQVPRLFRLAGHLGRTEETGPGKGVRWLGGQWDGRVNVNHK